MHQDKSCKFCKIAEGQDASAVVVGEGKEWVAFFPPEPATPGHTLVIPRSHVRDLWELPDEFASWLMQAVIHVGIAIRRAVRPEGMNLISSSGAAAEQSVFHLHLHLVPRWKQDGFGEIWPQDKRYERKGLGDVARLVRTELARGE
jgi:histidine triad (HIT) family protein